MQGKHTGKKHELLPKILPLSGKSYFLESAHWTCTQTQIYCLFLSNAYINCYMYMYILKNWSLAIIRQDSFSDFVLHVQHTWNFYKSLDTLNNGKLIWYFKTSWYAILLYTKVWLKNLCTKFFSISIEFSARILQTDFDIGLIFTITPYFLLCSKGIFTHRLILLQENSSIPVSENPRFLCHRLCSTIWWKKATSKNCYTVFKWG